MSRDNPRPGREPAASQPSSADELFNDPDAGASADPEAADEAWDANDPRRQRDQFAPPQDPCECRCLHCDRVFMSDRIWFQRVINDPQGFEGFWMCPTPNCGGAGFTFDIFPTDPDHPANVGWHYDDDDEDEGEWDEEGAEEFEEGVEWDPEESKYKALDEAFGEEDDDDIDGEEWKYGLAPGERPPEPDWMESGRREREEQERRYNEPDERPRVVDWGDREDRQNFSDDDIPF
jgi:hypothetical protein